jgi:molecular chaperone GrpE
MREQSDRQDGEREPQSSEEDPRPIGVDTDPDDLADGVEEDGVEAEMVELRTELAELRDRHLRLAAEFDNYRKRNERDRLTLVTRLQVDLVASLLEVIDDLERVADSGADTTPDAVIEGIHLVEKKFRSVLQSAGLEAIDAEGELFDPAVMEAMMVVPTDDPSQDDCVADVFQRGYRFGDVLVRPARVRVLKYEGAAEGSE